MRAPRFNWLDPISRNLGVITLKESQVLSLVKLFCYRWNAMHIRVLSRDCTVLLVTPSCGLGSDVFKQHRSSVPFDHSQNGDVSVKREDGSSMIDESD